MKRTRLLRVLCALLAFEAAGAVPTPAGPVMTILRSETLAQGDTILLAYLLPENASQKLRQIAESVSLGTSPQPGTTRRIMRSTVVSILEASGLTPSLFTVPEEIDVHRATRTITRQEVFSAIQTSLAANPVPGMPQFGPDDLTFESSLVVPAGGAHLHVTQFTFDRLEGQARFRLWSPAKPLVLPFFVTAALRAPRPIPGQASFPFAPDVASAATVALVDPRRSARLRLHSANSEMMLQVQPLTLGHLGEVIPVRLLTSRKTLRARVVGAGSLDASF
jgi:hypothetical protein